MSSTGSDLRGAINKYLPSVLATMRPSTVADVHAWARYIWRYQGFYKSSIKKSIDYFITEAELDVPKSANKSNNDIYEFMKVFNRNYSPIEIIKNHARNLAAMGTSCFTIIPKIKRSLICECGYSGFIGKFENVRFNGKSFSAKCPVCDKHGEKIHSDVEVVCKSKDTAPNACFWKIENLIISYNEISGSRSIYYNFKSDQNIAPKIRSNDKEYLFTTEFEILKAAYNRRNLVLSETSTVFDRLNDIHSDEVDVGSWGMPMFMADFESMLICILIEFYAYGILDSNLTLSKILVPDEKSLGVNADESFGSVDGDSVKKMLSGVINKLNSGDQYIPAPIGISVQTLGGEAKSLVPIELLEYFRKDVLKSIGVPAEFSDGAGNVGQLLMFSLFEKQWSDILDSMNNALSMIKNVASVDGTWDSSYISLVSVDKFNDPNSVNMKHQLFSSNAISGESFFRSIGLDFDKEQQAVLFEQLEQGKKMEAFDKKMKELGMGEEIVKEVPIAEQILINREEQAAQEQVAQQQVGPAPAGPAPEQQQGPAQFDPDLGISGSDDGGEINTVEQLSAKAEDIASSIMGMDMTTRSRQLRALSNNNKNLHALVKAELDRLEGDVMMQALTQQRGG